MPVAMPVVEEPEVFGAQLPTVTDRLYVPHSAVSLALRQVRTYAVAVGFA